MPDEIAWTEQVQGALLRAASAAAPRECAVLLGGERREHATWITDLVELPNVARGDDAFEVPPAAFARAEQQLAARGAPFVGFAHSHPRGSCAPSLRDREQLWTGCVQLITDGRRIEAFWLTAGCAVRPLRLRVAEASR